MSVYIVFLNFCTCCVLQDFIYPENVAYPIGGPGNPRFLVMEIHYDNPDMRSGMLVRLSEVGTEAEYCYTRTQSRN